jgi:hypothetical protein
MHAMHVTWHVTAVVQVVQVAYSNGSHVGIALNPE